MAENKMAQVAAMFGKKLEEEFFARIAENKNDCQNAPSEWLASKHKEDDDGKEIRFM